MNTYEVETLARNIYTTHIFESIGLLSHFDAITARLRSFLVGILEDGLAIKLSHCQILLHTLVLDKEIFLIVAHTK